ncbi:MAG: hypothetical protein H7259_07560 [Cytophagales bacterium]|nr:hypothetical protein [Cytophaga sp.]
MKRILVYFSTIAFAASLANCTQQKDQKTTTVVTTPDSPNVLVQAILLNDLASAQWNSMMAADSVKFTDINRLLQEISYCKKYDEKEYERLMKLKNQVYAMRYTEETLSDSSIDLYDAATSDLINKVRNLKVATPEILQHPLADQLENDIMKSENEEVILYRTHYDQAAAKYNSFLEANKEAIEKESPGVFRKKKTFSVAL